MTAQLSPDLDKLCTVAEAVVRELHRFEVAQMGGSLTTHAETLPTLEKIAGIRIGRTTREADKGCILVSPVVRDAMPGIEALYEYAAVRVIVPE